MHALCFSNWKSPDRRLLSSQELTAVEQVFLWLKVCYSAPKLSRKLSGGVSTEVCTIAGGIEFLTYFTAHQTMKKPQINCREIIIPWRMFDYYDKQGWKQSQQAAVSETFYTAKLYKVWRFWSGTEWANLQLTIVKQCISTKSNKNVKLLTCVSETSLGEIFFFLLCR